MLRPHPRWNRISQNKILPASIALAISLLLTVAASVAHAQTFTVLHAFSGPDGYAPYAGLTADQAGNFYGTTEAGGNNGCQSQIGCGTVFKLSHTGSGWVLTTLYKFQGGSDGWEPFARVLFGPDGSLYGTTEYGGDQSGFSGGYGTVFKLTPPAHVCETVSCPWTHTVLYRFTGRSDGSYPGPGDLTFDNAGNIYGTTEAGGLVESNCFLGNEGCGVVYKLTPSGGGWTESIVYSFTGADDGDLPIGGVTFDMQGNLYGTASEGGTIGYGTVFQLTPSGSGWTETTLHSFSGQLDGGYPAAGLIFDTSGNLYGTTSSVITSNYDGSAFQLTPSNGGWTFNLLYDFPFPSGPEAGVTLHNGDLYGTTADGGSDGFGSVYELMPGSGGWTASTLYSFSAHNDGSNPDGSVLVDASGNVYGTADGGGQYSGGVVWEITPWPDSFEPA